MPICKGCLIRVHEKLLEIMVEYNKQKIKDDLEKDKKGEIRTCDKERELVTAIIIAQSLINKLIPIFK